MPDPVRVFNIAAHQPFADTLARGVLARYADPGDPAALARVEILLPTRRAQRALAQAFLRAAGGRPTLLPRMAPLGDLDEDELALSPVAAAEIDLAPAIAPLRRRLALARLVAQWSTAQDRPPATVPAATPAMAIDQAVRLAAPLADLLDEVQTQRLSFDALNDLVPDRYAAHWQEVLTFLRIVVDQWPAVLAALAVRDPVDRRNAVVAARLAAWRAEPPAHPVIAAGSTGSIPATADLLRAVAGLPAGAVVLPGLDTDLDEHTWHHIGPSHPQYGLADLLSHLDLARTQVTPWHAAAETADPDPALPLFAATHHAQDRRVQARQRFLSEVMRPADTSQRWADLDPIPATALDRVTYIPCPSDRDEAATIALIMREVLEQRDPPRTCALITPDRKLARRVAAALGRWAVTVDDSAGVPVHLTPPVTFLRLCIDVVAQRWAPLPLLALLKHPLAAAGGSPAALRAAARRLERAILRGPRPAPGIAGLRAALTGLAADPRRRAAPPELFALLDRLDAMAAPLTAFFAPTAGAIDPAAVLQAHLAFAEALATAADLPGPARLWSGDAGEAAARLLADLADALAGTPAIPAARYPALFDVLLDGVAVRPRHGGHPRLAILGLLEARMQRFDVTILGGLNEGTWPPQPAPDPWMSRQMRHDFGLPDSERRVGLAAHDFVQAFSAPVVVMTRAERVDGTPTVPARWLTRMHHVARQAGLDLAPSGSQAADWRHWQRSLDRVEDWPGRPGRPGRLGGPRRPPAPCPPVAARPRQLAVTHIQRWMRNPYDIYARHVLRLRQLDALDDPPRASHYGSVIHGVLDVMVSRYPSGALPAAALAELLDLGAAAFAPYAAYPSVHAFWWPRFERIARWFIANEAAYRVGLTRSVTETTGTLTIDAPAGPFTLTAKADRIDLTRDGTLRIVDYKTGSAPSFTDVDAGLEPQLSLEAAIARSGGFAGVPAAEAAELAYWSLRGGDPAGEVKPLKGDAAALATDALAGLGRLVAAFDDPATPYECRPRAAAAPRFDDYAHLARVKEWASGEDVA